MAPAADKWITKAVELVSLLHKPRCSPSRASAQGLTADAVGPAWSQMVNSVMPLTAREAYEAVPQLKAVTAPPGGGSSSAGQSGAGRSGAGPSGAVVSSSEGAAASAKRRGVDRPTGTPQPGPVLDLGAFTPAQLAELQVRIAQQLQSSSA